MQLTDKDKYVLAKSFTELAIQNGVFNKYADPSDTAKEVSEFFNTIVENVCNDSTCK